jgi:hypothetical protein
LTIPVGPNHDINGLKWAIAWKIYEEPQPTNVEGALTMATTHMFHQAWEWPGFQLVDPDGEKIGEVLEIYVDAATGQPAWLAISTGWFGTRVSMIPVTDASPRGDHELVSTWSKDQVKSAPNVAHDGELSEEEERELFRYYGVDYGDMPIAATDDAGDDATTRQQVWAARLQRHQRGVAARSPGDAEQPTPGVRDLRPDPVEPHHN